MSIFLQMLPILIFIIVDSIFNNSVISIISAILFAIIQVTVTYIKTSSIDYLIFIDVALISILGIVSIVQKNDFFFLIKPAVIDVVMVIFLIALSFSSDNFIFNYLTRFMPEQQHAIIAQALPFLRKMLLWLSLYTILHGIAVWYCANNCSRRLWGIIAGPGYFIIFIPIMFFILGKRIIGHKNTQKD